jgi:sterol desaturase/sphingolipid hydroxylase (fatty acid hydroxylase superfamily)
LSDTQTPVEKHLRLPEVQAREVMMRLISSLLLLVALLAMFLWLTVEAIASLAGVVAILFLVLFILSLFCKKGHPERL